MTWATYTWLLNTSRTLLIQSASFKDGLLVEGAGENMNIHEYQGKALLKAAGVPVLEGVHCTSVEQALAAYDSLGSKIVAVKSQIHAGGRGKAGGVKLVSSPEEIEEFAKILLKYDDKSGAFLTISWSSGSLESKILRGFNLNLP